MSMIKLSDLNQDIIFRILGYVTFTERERYANLSDIFRHGVHEWHRLETRFPNKYSWTPTDEEFDRKYNIKRVLLFYGNIKYVDCTKLRNNSLKETADLINFWTKRRLLIHIKPVNEHNWIRVLKEPLIRLFKSCPISSIDLYSVPSTVFNESFLKEIIFPEKLDKIWTNYLNGFIKISGSLTNLRQLVVDSLTDGQFKQLICLKIETLIIRRDAPSRKICSMLEQLTNLVKLEIVAIDYENLEKFLQVNGNNLKRLKIRNELNRGRGHFMSQIDVFNHLLSMCPNMKKCTIGAINFNHHHI